MTKTYNVNGKEYTELSIRTKCADLLDVAWHLKPNEFTRNWQYSDRYLELGDGGKAVELPDYCNNWSDAEPIIEKCWNELMVKREVGYYDCERETLTRWEVLMQKHQCTKLVAACICFIENNES